MNERRATVSACPKGSTGSRSRASSPIGCSSAFEGMTLTRERGNTVLTGPVRDQAELQGLLQRVSDLGLTLLSAIAVEEEAARR